MEDYDIIQQCLSGDKNAFEELVNRYKNLVYSIILRMTNDTEEANDLAQEVFIKVYRNLDKYSPQYKFSTWIIRITTNLVIDHRRKQKQATISLDNMIYEPVAEGTPEESYLRQERRNAVQSILDQMPDMYRIPIILYHQQGLSYKEIADVIDEPLSKVKNRIFRARKMIKEEWLTMKEGEIYEV
ncbi:MAG: sigma-70 family RNA polymerase sigma factor [Epulopiscium sp.]|nr:sigma-70 family RNA polymerase sigma factor [Candidatus Epulonipiscium sp.]